MSRPSLRRLVVVLVVVLGVGAALPTLALAQSDSASCAALQRLDLQSLPGAPARVTGARLVTPPNATPVAQYCQVTGYVAPQNKFELRMPLPAAWNQKFFFALCAGFCGQVIGNFCNQSLARGYAAVTSNGGHDGAPGFDGVWAANAPKLQEDFAHRSTHVVTLAAKAIVARYYGRPIARSYISDAPRAATAPSWRCSATRRTSTARSPARPSTTGPAR